MDALDKIENLGWSKENIHLIISKAGKLEITVKGCSEKWDILLNELKGRNSIDLESDIKLYEFQEYRKEGENITFRLKLVS